MGIWYNAQGTELESKDEWIEKAKSDGLLDENNKAIGSTKKCPPQFHDFLNMLIKLQEQKSGAAYLYGNYSPLYIKGGWHGASTRIDSGTSAGSFNKPGWDFTPEQQRSIHWVIIPELEWEFQEEMLSAMCSRMHKNEAERINTYVAKAREVYNELPGWRKWFFDRGWKVRTRGGSIVQKNDSTYGKMKFLVSGADDVFHSS